MPLSIRKNGSWQEAPTTARIPPRGPSGLWTPPLTPAYTTPATYTANSFVSLQTALTQCAGGEVIEVTSDLRGSSIVIAKTTGSTPSSGWTQNVLVRPPLGTRLNCDAFNLYCQHVTIAGFNFDTAGERAITRNPSSNETTTPTSSGSYSGFWRCVDTMDVSNTTSSVKWGVYAGYHPFLIECAAPYYHPTITADRIDIYGNTHGGYATSVFSPMVKGCFFSGVRRDDSVDTNTLHVDNMQIEAPASTNSTVFNPSVLHSIIDGSSGNSAIFCKNIEGDFNVYNNWLGYDGSENANYSLGIPAAVNDWGTVARTHIAYTDFAKLLPRIYTYQSLQQVYTYHMNRAAENSLSDGDPVDYMSALITSDDGTNQFNLSPIPRPSLANLTIIWPECPLAITPTASPN